MRWPFQNSCPLRDHTYLNKPAAFSFELQVCISMYDLLVDTRHEGLKIVNKDLDNIFLKSY